MLRLNAAFLSVPHRSFYFIQWNRYVPLTACKLDMIAYRNLNSMLLIVYREFYENLNEEAEHVYGHRYLSLYRVCFHNHWSLEVKIMANVSHFSASNENPRCSGYTLIQLSMALQPFVGPWPLIQFRNLFYTDDRTPWTSDQPVARPLPTHRTTQTQNKRKYKYPCLEWDSSPRPQRSSKRRQFMPKTARPLWSAVT
jgi:hypothetical protein